MKSNCPLIVSDSTWATIATQLSENGILKSVNQIREKLTYKMDATIRSIIRSERMVSLLSNSAGLSAVRSRQPMGQNDRIF